MLFPRETVYEFQLNERIHQSKELFGELSPSEDWASKIQKPFPFQYQKTCESPHPVRDSCKMKDTVIFTGARKLCLKFDARCATQYDYDKLTLFSGTG